MSRKFDDQSAGGPEAGQATPSVQRCRHPGQEAQEEEEHEPHLQIHDGGHRDAGRSRHRG